MTAFQAVCRRFEPDHPLLKNMKNYTWKVLYKGRKPIGLVYSISSWNAEKIAIEKFSKIYKKEDIWIEKQISQNNSVGRVAVL